MKCVNCGVNLPNKSKYCPRCGSLFTVKDDVDLYCDREDIEYVSIYFSDSKVRMYFYNISLGFLVFNFLYLFYKKLYVDGVVSLFGFLLFMFVVINGYSVLVGSLGFFAVPIIFAVLISLFIYFYYLFNFNNIYMASVKYRINKIVKRNPLAGEEEIIELCKKDSRPNWLVLFIMLILLFVSFFIYFS